MNIKLSHKVAFSTFSKLSINSWKKSTDPSTLVKLEIDVTDVITQIKTFNKKVKSKVSLTHFVAAVLSQCLSTYPELNRVLIGRQLYERKEINIFFTAFVKENKQETDLSGITIEKCDTKSVQEIASEVETKIVKLRRGEDRHLKAVRRLIKPIPKIFLRTYINLFEFILYTLNLPLTFLGLPRDPFGSVMITSLGGFGLDTVYAPIPPLSRTPLLVCIGKPHIKPWVVDKKIVPRKILSITFTFDHRLLHGVQGAKPYRLFKKLFNSPEKILKNIK